MEETKAKCPKCKSRNLSINECWKGHTVTWEQQDGKIDRNNGVLETGDPYKLEGHCRNCGHWWRIRGLQITDIIKFN